MTAARTSRRLFVALLALLVADQVADRLLLSDGSFLGRRVAPFDPPLFCAPQREVLEGLAAHDARLGKKFDAQLGWCNLPDSGFGDFRYDWAGARIAAEPLPRSRTPGVRRILALGCSMTHGEEVGPEESWCAQLDAAREDIEVANLGVAAYGVDQCLLRLRRDGPALAADEVWLGLLPAAAPRVTTVYRPLLDHWSLDVALKPCFELQSGQLILVPNPVNSLDEIPPLIGDQHRFLQVIGPHDPWIQRARLAYAPAGTSWTHGSFSARIVLSLLEAGGREPWRCFAPGDSGVQALLTAIVRAIAAEAEGQGARFRLLILPGKGDLASRGQGSPGYWEDWTDCRRREGIEVIDLSEALERCALSSDELFAPLGHYTPAGNQVVARALSQRLGGIAGDR